jgi:glutaminyl-peptide cyclotransferase
VQRLRREGRRRLLILIAACVCLSFASPLKPTEPAGFSGGHAFEDLKHLVSFGPRPSGSAALDKTREWLVHELRGAGAEGEEDSFTASTPIGPLPMTNLIAKFPGSGRETVIVAGHYDTKRFDDFRFVGANDGGSSAALLVELARVLNGQKHALNYWLVFFDGEEAVRTQWEGTDNTYGSRHLVEKLSQGGELSRIKALILVDMVGDAQLRIPRESNSTPWLTDLVFRTAQGLGYSKYFVGSQDAVEDDHIPFVNAGVSALDLIDLDYGPNGSYWHTAQDTPEHCSPLSLTIVGRVVVASLEELDKSPSKK